MVLRRFTAPRAVWSKLVGQAADAKFYVYSQVVETEKDTWNQLKPGNFPDDKKAYGFVIQTDGSIVACVSTISLARDAAKRRFSQNHFFRLSAEDSLLVNYNASELFRTLPIEDFVEANHDLLPATADIDVELIASEQRRLLSKLGNQNSFWLLLQLVLERHHVMLEKFYPENIDSQSNLAGLLIRLIPSSCRRDLSIGFEVLNPDTHESRLQFLTPQLAPNSKYPREAYSFDCGDGEQINNSKLKFYADRFQTYLEGISKDPSGLRYAFLLRDWYRAHHRNADTLFNFVASLSGLKDERDSFARSALNALHERHVAFDVLKSGVGTDESSTDASADPQDIANLATSVLYEEIDKGLDTSDLIAIVARIIQAIRRNGSLFSYIDPVPQLYILIKSDQIRSELLKIVESLFQSPPEHASPEIIKAVVEKWQNDASIYETDMYLHCAVFAASHLVDSWQEKYGTNGAFKNLMQLISSEGFLPADRLSETLIHYLLGHLSDTERIEDTEAKEKYWALVKSVSDDIESWNYLAKDVPTLVNNPEVLYVTRVIENRHAEDPHLPLVSVEFLITLLQKADGDHFSGLLLELLVQLQKKDINSPEFFETLLHVLTIYGNSVAPEVLGRLACIAVWRTHFDIARTAYNVSEQQKGEVAFVQSFIRSIATEIEQNPINLVTGLATSLEGNRGERLYQMILDAVKPEELGFSRIDLAISFWKFVSGKSSGGIINRKLVQQMLTIFATLQDPNDQILTRISDMLSSIPAEMTETVVQSFSTNIRGALLYYLAFGSRFHSKTPTLINLILACRKEEHEQLWEIIKNKLEKEHVEIPHETVEKLRPIFEQIYQDSLFPQAYIDILQIFELHYAMRLWKEVGYKAFDKYVRDEILIAPTEEENIERYGKFSSRMLETDPTNQQSIIGLFNTLISMLKANLLDNIYRVVSIPIVRTRLISVLPEHYNVLVRLTRRNPKQPIQFDRLESEAHQYNLGSSERSLLLVAEDLKDNDLIQGLIRLILRDSSTSDIVNILETFKPDLFDHLDPTSAGNILVRLYSESRYSTTLRQLVRSYIPHRWSQTVSGSERAFTEEISKSDFVGPSPSRFRDMFIADNQISLLPKIRILWLCAKGKNSFPSVFEIFSEMINKADSIAFSPEIDNDILSGVNAIITLPSARSTPRSFWISCAAIGFIYFFNAGMKSNRILQGFLDDEKRKTLYKGQDYKQVLWEGLRIAVGKSKSTSITFNELYAWLNRKDEASVVKSLVSRASMSGMLGIEIAFRMQEYTADRLNLVSLLIDSLDLSADKNSLLQVRESDPQRARALAERYRGAVRRLSERTGTLNSTLVFFDTLKRLGDEIFHK